MVYCVVVALRYREPDRDQGRLIFGIYASPRYPDNESLHGCNNHVNVQGMADCSHISGPGHKNKRLLFRPEG